MAADIDEIVAGLTPIQAEAIRRSLFLSGTWGLSDWREDSVDITEWLSEDIADPVSGILTDLGVQVRARLLQGGGEPNA